jgi:hypothetical protein
MDSGPAKTPRNRPVLDEQGLTSRVIRALEAQIETLQAHIDSLKVHTETLKGQLAAAEARAEKQACEFAARDARHLSDLNVERTLADRMSARVDQMTAELACEQALRAKAERDLAAQLGRRWWKLRTP